MTHEDKPAAENIVWHGSDLDRAARWKLLGARGAVIWLTGLSGSGKSTVAVAAEQLLLESGQPAVRLDGDNVRHGLCGDLGFSADDRRENIRRVAETAVLFADSGAVALVPLISPYRESRDAARQIAQRAEIDFVECFVDTPIELCEQRDPKGLYKLARAGEITGFTGIDDPYEAPLKPELRLTPADGDPVSQAQLLLEASAFLAAARRR